MAPFVILQIQFLYTKKIKLFNKLNHKEQQNTCLECLVCVSFYSDKNLSIIYSFYKIDSTKIKLNIK